MLWKKLRIFHKKKIALFFILNSNDVTLIDKRSKIYLKNEQKMVIKMDIEGSEYDALLGASKTLQNCEKIFIAVTHQIPSHQT